MVFDGIAVDVVLPGVTVTEREQMVMVAVLRGAVGVGQGQACGSVHVFKNRGVVDFQAGIEEIIAVRQPVAGVVSDDPAKARAVALGISPFVVGREEPADQILGMARGVGFDVQGQNAGDRGAEREEHQRGYNDRPELFASCSHKGVPPLWINYYYTIIVYLK